MQPDPAMVAWYDRKTDYWLEKYGPGPIIHYHTGLVDPDEPAGADEAALKAQLSRAQDAMLRRACRVWDAANTMTGELVDVGCGLGGSAIFFAQNYQARVTAVSPVPRHVEVVGRLSREAGVGPLVTPMLGEAHALPGPARFDAAYAIGASNYFDRPRWFRHLAEVLRPGGSVCLEDSFVERPALAPPFDDYWVSHVGSFDEYRRAAADAGFELVAEEDVTREAAGFWRLSVAYSLEIIEKSGLPAAAREERRRSIDWLGEFYEAHLDGGFTDRILRFRRR